jgi:hypothetical protein
MLIIVMKISHTKVLQHLHGNYNVQTVVIEQLQEDLLFLQRGLSPFKSYDMVHSVTDDNKMSCLCHAALLQKREN